MSARTGLAALLLCVFAVYAPTLSNGFAGDDVYRVRAVRPDGSPNPITDRLHPIAGYFTFTWSEFPEIYRPITVLSYALANEVGGCLDGDPAGPAWLHHLLNVILHVWTVLLVWRILEG